MNIVPSFITLNGPVREVRFKFKTDGKRDGGVHNLYTIGGRTDAPGCVLTQPDFKREAARENLQLLHRCFDTWRGIGDIVAGMARQEYDLELRRYDGQGWRAMFLP
jgi:hypothetical protein